MLAGTAAAALIDWAERFGTIGGSFKKLFHAAESVSLFRFDNAYLGALAGQKARNKDRHAVMAANALRVLAKVFAGHFKDIVSAQHNASVCK